RASRRTMAKPRSSIASPPSKETPQPRAISVSCTTTARASRRTMAKPRSGCLAAEQGNATAQSNLGSMYYSGQGVPQNYVQAYMWLDLAASRSSAREDRDEAVSNRNVVASKMSREQLAEAKKLLREWKPKLPAR